MIKFEVANYATDMPLIILEDEKDMADKKAKKIDNL